MRRVPSLNLAIWTNMSTAELTCCRIALTAGPLWRYALLGLVLGIGYLGAAFEPEKKSTPKASSSKSSK